MQHHNISAPRRWIDMTIANKYVGDAEQIYKMAELLLNTRSPRLNFRDFTHLVGSNHFTCRHHCLDCLRREQIIPEGFPGTTGSQGIPKAKANLHQGITKGSRGARLGTKCSTFPKHNVQKQLSHLNQFWDHVALWLS